ncbi:MAG TPA: ABC transporter permease [Thermoanaerobaculia bacterium]|nr:ABC transporter permease [Thermoanaerobaculia bacterium]
MLRNYIKLALKVLGRRKFFSFISLFGISLTLMVLMVATAILDNLIAPRAPETHLDRTLAVYVLGMYNGRGGRTGPPGYRFLDRTIRNLPDAENASLFTQSNQLVLFHEGRKIETHLRRTDGAYWQIYQYKFLEGGPFTQTDDDSAHFVAVINRDMREKLFGKASAIGRTFEAEGRSFRVIGVVESVPITRYATFSEIWAPIGTMKTSEYRREDFGGFGGVVLARSKADFPKLRAAFDERVRAYPRDAEFPTIRTGLDTSYEAFARLMTGNQPTAPTTLVSGVLLVAALLFITLPTLNLISINLSRIMERASEIGVRKAFGASSRALVAQFVVENVVLTLIGGLVGFFLTMIALSLFNRADLIPYAVFDVNLRIFGLGMAVAALFGIISGVYPAWRMSRMHPVNALRGGAL